MGPWGWGAKKRELAETAPTLSSQHAQQHSMGDENLDRNNNLQKLHHVLVPFTESWMAQFMSASCEMFDQLHQQREPASQTLDVILGGGYNRNTKHIYVVKKICLTNVNRKWWS